MTHHSIMTTDKPSDKENITWLGMCRRDAARKSIPKVNNLKVFTIDFSRDPVCRESQLAIGWSEQKCKECDELAKEDHTYKLTPEERRRYKGPWYLTLNKEGKNGPMKLRSDYRAADMMNNRLHHESREPIEECIHPGQQRRIPQGQEVFSEDFFSSAPVDQHTGWECWPSSTSSTWWYAHNFFTLLRSFFVTVGCLQLTAIHCDRRSVDRTPSHETFRHFHPCAHITLWLKVSHDVSA